MQSRKFWDCPRRAHAEANSTKVRFQRHTSECCDLQGFAEVNYFSSEINDGLVG